MDFAARFWYPTHEYDERQAMMRSWRSRFLGALIAVSAAALVAGCEDQFDNSTASGRASAPIPAKTLAKMDQIGTTAAAPVVIRAYKQEAEFEIWKQKSDGHYALLKTYPICRWSGQLGPKKIEGDYQVPEGFYTINQSQMNPNSHWYLSFNVGYPNAYDQALGRGGGSIMVHGSCGSAGCFSMTDAQIAEIYAIMREAFAGGQTGVQMQSYPFRMTAENLAKHRFDPNIAFWKELKNGSDHFEVTQSEPTVLVCGRHYHFGATSSHPVSASSACPELENDEAVETAVAAKARQDDVQVAQQVAKGVKPILIVYEDGGENPAFRDTVDMLSHPEAVENPPKEIVLGENGKPLKIPPVVQVASSPTPTPTGSTFQVASASSTAVGPAAAAAPSTGFNPLGGITNSSKSLMSGLISSVSGAPQIQIYEPTEPVPADVPLPPKRSADLDKQLKMATAKVDDTGQ
jgi:murein L,D-transpeptidase YafK